MISVKKATKRLNDFSARGSNCPICKKNFRHGCLHNVNEAYDYLENQLLNAKIDKRIKKFKDIKHGKR